MYLLLWDTSLKFYYGQLKYLVGASTCFLLGELGSAGIRKLVEVMSSGPFHNPAERSDPPKCHPKTGKAVLKKILDWRVRETSFFVALQPCRFRKISYCSDYHWALKLLAASFFFFRTAAGCGDYSRLIATLTYQLCLSIPEIRTYVDDSVELEIPIYYPFLWRPSYGNWSSNHCPTFATNWTGVLAIHPRLIIIDGLDECASSTYVQRSVFQILAEKLPVSMLFLVASRSQPIYVNSLQSRWLQ